MPAAACDHAALYPSQAAHMLHCLVIKLSVYSSTPDRSTVGAALQEHGELQAAVELSCVAAGLQPVAPFVHKCLQLHETFGVRFGVMLIGPTGGNGCCPLLMSCCTFTAACIRLYLVMAGQGCAQPLAQKCHAAK